MWQCASGNVKSVYIHGGDKHLSCFHCSCLLSVTWMTTKTVVEGNSSHSMPKKALSCLSVISFINFGSTVELEERDEHKRVTKIHFLFSVGDNFMEAVMVKEINT